MYRVMTEEEMLEGFEAAIADEQFYVCYQPQINHMSGRIVGAEALIRWKSPEFGVQFPGDFIPVLERNNLIYRADLFVFEAVCRMIRKCLDEGISIVPISVNMSRYDIIDHDYVGDIEKIRKKYNVPIKLLRIEITESTAIGGSSLMMSILDRLHVCGYMVEMDDFGSGYSSLNILKDLDVDVIKLDMSFLSENVGGRGGVIISSMVQMTKWLNTPVIAEGVETVEQADYMQSLGCNYIQGYLYSKPVPEEEFLKLMQKMDQEPIKPAISIAKGMGAGSFWDPDSFETLIFNDFVGAAAIFSYEDGKVEILRVNKKYLEEVGMNLTEQEVLNSNPWDNHSENSRKIYEDTMLRAIESGEEESCEHWRHIHSRCCGDDHICVRAHIRMIGNAGKQYIMYARIRNITKEKRLFNAVVDSEKRFRYASEQANVYAWEYDIAKREMHPCFRCMRDLGLPMLVKNYPEPAIEMGIFPPDYADMYRDWHRQLEQGVEKLEAVIPLTVGRVPFIVRYTTEFDENGKPYKAYGSATLVVDNPV
ncbi:MAG: EAL domain-containing protein [Lachnospiraceae bacterium]|nr:EAL domain-containing protein [Lachnospiraceae bacterium]